MKTSLMHLSSHVLRKMMQRLSTPFTAAACVFAAMLALPMAVHAGSDTNAPARPASVFADDLQGKDPFFPDSVRRLQTIAHSSGTNSATRALTITTRLILKGISGSKTQPMALINNSTFSEGEAGEVRSGAQYVKIRCREIRDRSVLVEIDGTGEVRELKLREGI